MVEQELHDLEGAGLGAVVQRRVALHRLPVHVGTDLDEVLGDPEVALVARDHQAGVSVAVGNLDVWKRKEKRVRFRGLAEKGKMRSSAKFIFAPYVILMLKRPMSDKEPSKQKLEDGIYFASGKD